MSLTKNYMMGFDAWALALFAAIMLPNIFWFAVPAPVDVLRVDSVTEDLDTVASVLQIAMLAALCLLKNRDAEDTHLSALVVAAGACVLVYYICWIAYYLGVVAMPVVLGMAIFPCAAFVLYAADRKNWIAFALACAFALCHLIFAVCNFVL